MAITWSFLYGSRVSYESLWLCSWVLIVISWGSWRSRSYVYDSGKFYRRCRICPRRTGYSGRVVSFLMKEQLLCSCVLTCFVMRMLEGLWQCLFLESFILMLKLFVMNWSFGAWKIFLLFFYGVFSALVDQGAGMHGIWKPWRQEEPHCCKVFVRIKGGCWNLTSGSLGNPDMKDEPRLAVLYSCVVAHVDQ